MFNTIVRTFLLQKLVWLRVIATRGDIAGGGREHEHERHGLNNALPALLGNAAQAINTVSKPGIAIPQNWCCDDERTAVASYLLAFLPWWL